MPSARACISPIVRPSRLDTLPHASSDTQEYQLARDCMDDEAWRRSVPQVALMHGFRPDPDCRNCDQEQQNLYDPTLDRVCTPLTAPCSDDQFESAPPTATTDRSCGSKVQQNELCPEDDIKARLSPKVATYYYRSSNPDPPSRAEWCRQLLCWVTGTGKSRCGEHWIHRWKLEECTYTTQACLTGTCKCNTYANLYLVRSGSAECVCE